MITAALILAILIELVGFTALMGDAVNSHVKDGDRALGCAFAILLLLVVIFQMASIFKAYTY